MDFGNVINKFRKFSEWHDFAGANQDLLNSEIGYMMLLKEVVSTDFGTTNRDFSRLVETAKSICNSITKTNSSVSFITRDLEHLVSVHEGFAKQKEEMRAIQKEADDAVKQVRELHEKLVNLQQTSNNTDEIVRCQTWYDGAVKKEDVCRAKYEQHKQVYDVEFAAYQKEFVQTLTAVLGEVFKVKAKNIDDIEEKLVELNCSEVSFGINFEESDERVNAELAHLKAWVEKCEKGMDERISVRQSDSEDLLVVSEKEGEWPDDSSEDGADVALDVDEERPFIQIDVKRIRKPRLRRKRVKRRVRAAPPQAELKRPEKEQKEKAEAKQMEEARPKPKLDYREFLVDSMMSIHGEKPRVMDDMSDLLDETKVFVADSDSQSEGSNVASAHVEASQGATKRKLSDSEAEEFFIDLGDEEAGNAADDKDAELQQSTTTVGKTKDDVPSGETKPVEVPEKDDGVKEKKPTNEPLKDETALSTNEENSAQQDGKSEDSKDAAAKPTEDTTEKPAEQDAGSKPQEASNTAETATPEQTVHDPASKETSKSETATPEEAAKSAEAPAPEQTEKDTNAEDTSIPAESASSEQEKAEPAAAETAKETEETAKPAEAASPEQTEKGTEEKVEPATPAETGKTEEAAKPAEAAKETEETAKPAEAAPSEQTEKAEPAAAETPAETGKTEEAAKPAEAEVKPAAEAAPPPAAPTPPKKPDPPRQQQHQNKKRKGRKGRRR